MLEKNGNISPKDMDLIPILDTPDEVSKYIADFYNAEADRVLSPNYNF